MKPSRNRLATVFGLVLAWMPAWSGAQVASEPEIKAAFVYNFTKFVEWPPSAGGNADRLQICIAGQGPVAEALSVLEGRTAQGRLLRTRPIAGADEVRACQLVYVSGIGEPRVAEVLRAARGLPVLTISDLGGFTDAGGMIGLVRSDERMRFEVNLGAAREGGIKISAHLLTLASAVKGKP